METCGVKWFKLVILGAWAVLGSCSVSCSVSSALHQGQSRIRVLLVLEKKEIRWKNHTAPSNKARWDELVCYS